MDRIRQFCVKGNHRVYLQSATLYPSARRVALTEEMRKERLVFTAYLLETTHKSSPAQSWIYLMSILSSTSNQLDNIHAGSSRTFTKRAKFWPNTTHAILLCIIDNNGTVSPEERVTIYVNIIVHFLTFSIQSNRMQ